MKVYNTDLKAIEPQLNQHDRINMHNAPSFAHKPYALPLLNYEERATYDICEKYLARLPDYQGAYGFGTLGGGDLDLRLCFNDNTRLDLAEIKTLFIQQLRNRGVDKDIDLLFMSGSEFKTGIRDLVELGNVEERLKDGFDPHERQAAVGDTSMFSLYIFATMRPIHESHVNRAGSPQELLESLILTREGVIGWSHFYTACFLHEYLNTSNPSEDPRYIERLAKFSSRVIAGATLAQLNVQQLVNIKSYLIAAIQTSGLSLSTDEAMSQMLITHPDTARLLDSESQSLLYTAGLIRSNTHTDLPSTFAADAELRLFYEAFQQGTERRTIRGGSIDPLTSYALGELIKDLGELHLYPSGSHLTTQGAIEQSVMYIPLKTHDKQDNHGVTIEVYNQATEKMIYYDRSAGSIVGEGAIFDLPRSATVVANHDTEAYVIDASKIKDILRDPDIQQQLNRQTLTSRKARRTDVLLRYFAREASLFTRRALSHTHLAAKERTNRIIGESPLAAYNMDLNFLHILETFAKDEDIRDTESMPNQILQSHAQPRLLFEVGVVSNYFYVVSKGTVEIVLRNGEHITMQQGELFGESSLLGLPTSGKAILVEDSKVIAISATWFTHFTQSRIPMQYAEMPLNLKEKLPVHLQYHLAFEGYEQVRRRLITHHTIYALEE